MMYNCAVVAVIISSGTIILTLACGDFILCVMSCIIIIFFIISFDGERNETSWLIDDGLLI